MPPTHERLSSPSGSNRQANGKTVKIRRGRAAVKDICLVGMKPLSPSYRDGKALTKVLSQKTGSWA
jgi:hypothetical protein